MSTSATGSRLARMTRAEVDPGLVVDLFGGLLLLALAGWATLVARTVGGDAAPLRDLLVLTAAVYALGRVLSELDRKIVPAGLAVGAATIGVLQMDTLLASPFGSPLGYANATAAFYVLAAAGAAIWALREPQPERATVAWVIGAGLALVPWLNGSISAAVSTVIVAAGVAVAIVADGVTRRRFILAAGGLVAAGFGMSVAMGLACNAGGCAMPGRLIGLLSRNRPRLWQDAVVLLRDSPVTGVGPDRYAFTSPTALSDADLFHAHNELLEVGAELGVAGLVLAAMVMLWIFVRLATSASGRGVVVVAAALCGLLLQSHIDYVLHTPWVVLASILLVAAAAASPPRAHQKT